MTITGEWVDPDDAPELSSEWFDQARVVRGGQTSARADQEQVSLRIDKDVLDRFRSSGPDWRSRINDALRRAAI